MQTLHQVSSPNTFKVHVDVLPTETVAVAQCRERVGQDRLLGLSAFMSLSAICTVR